MINLLLGLIIILAYLVFPSLPQTSPTSPPSDILSQPFIIQDTDGTSKAAARQAFLSLPLLFIENRGQVDCAAAYYVKAPGQTLYFTGEGVVFDLARHTVADKTDATSLTGERLVFHLDYVGANKGLAAEGRDRANAVVNYLTGDPEGWHTDIPTYWELVYHDIYPNIDLRLYGKSGMLEYEFVVGPGAAVSNIMLAFRGVDSLAVRDDELLITTAFGDLRQTRPYIYQQIGHELVEVQGGFQLVGSDTYCFNVPSYDPDYPLVIDPSLAYSTYLGGSILDEGYGIAVDASGCAYVTGRTSSYNFHIKDPFQGAYRGNIDAFVAKLDATGTGLVYSTYLGGAQSDYGYGIAVDSSGCAYITGYTGSDNLSFPLKNPYQGAYRGGPYDAFVAKLTADGSDLVYSTYLGGIVRDYGRGIAVDASGCAYITGYTSSNTTFPLKNPFQGTYGGGDYDAFVAKLDTTKSGPDSLAYSTYIGGINDDRGWGIAVDASSCAYITGESQSDNTTFPIKNPFQVDLNGMGDAFIVKLDTTKPGTDGLVYSTYLGGNSWDKGYGIAVNASDCAYVTGWTRSDNITFPIKNPFQVDLNGTSDAFVAKLTADGSDIVYSTYLGGDDPEEGRGIAVDTSDCAYITGYTGSDNLSFPLKNPFQGAYGGGPYDAFVAKLTADGSDLVYSTYLGGNLEDYGYGIAIDSSGCAYVTGRTQSDNITFPLKDPFQGAYGGGYFDAFVAKLCEAAPPSPPPTPTPPSIPPSIPPPPAPPPSPNVSPVTPLPAPAVLSLQYLKVHPRQAYAGQPVTVSTNVVNAGGETGNYIVVLRINGQAEQSRTVSVGPGGTYPVKFTVTKVQPSTYTVNIDGQQAKFTILGTGGRSSAPPISGGLIAILVMAVLVVVTAVMLALSFRRTA